ncbi:MAG: hypothetical protein ACXWLJ_03945 [Rhizomicrobium sp.]
MHPDIKAISALLFLLLVDANGGSALAAATADKRPAGYDFKPGLHYCVKNAESGACEDCWSGSLKSSKGGTCKLLKESTTEPSVRKGRCSDLIHTGFCKPKT